jgi:hypothetical protein
MPLGITRLNERTQRPNPLINFIKGPDATSLDFLNRIAAQCYPIMKQNHISVMSLEEFPPNNEFLGRNFNAGEVIQLVLKDKQGRWLGFKFVQMVMMHELAHCKQMNHSKFFWQVRNGFAGEMEGLWAKNYVGEGMWGRGKDLVTGSFVQERELAQGDVPEHLCGGTYRRKGRKRKRGGHPPSGEQGDERPKLTYAERQQKRIAKKFGVHGDLVTTSCYAERTSRLLEKDTLASQGWQTANADENYERRQHLRDSAPRSLSLSKKKLMSNRSRASSKSPKIARLTRIGMMLGLEEARVSASPIW